MTEKKLKTKHGTGEKLPRFRYYRQHATNQQQIASSSGFTTNQSILQRMKRQTCVVSDARKLIHAAANQTVVIPILN